MQVNYSLNYNDYTWKNALLWGNCFSHFHEVKTGTFGKRVVHLIICLAELFPIASQIGSIFEMLIIKHFSNQHSYCRSTNSSARYSRISENETFEELKNRMSLQISEIVICQQQNPTYKCPKLSAIDDSSINPSLKLYCPPEGIESYAKKAIYYAYNAEGIRDYGWGCGWRAIQTCLSSFGINVPFENLFHLFGPLENLKSIFRDKYPNENLIASKPFAPYELTTGWTEPFIAEMVMHFHGIFSNLESINNIPTSCNAPHLVFRNPAMTFANFKMRLEEHFKNENAAPVMIDDGLYTLNVIGIGCKDSNTILWIADPHIQEGVNRNLTDKTPNGLYTITLNNNGQQIKCSLDENDQHQKPHMFCAGSYEGLDFSNKPWMVLFPFREKR